MNAKIESMSLVLPSMRRSNEYWNKHFPDMVKSQGDRVNARIWSAEDSATDPWSEEMRAFIHDPFRGAKERRWLAPGETAFTLELQAAREALQAAGKTPADVDLLICTAFQPHNWGVGDATYLAQALEMNGSAYNIESACSGGLVALQNAWAQIKSGQHKNVLVVVSCTYSRAEAETDSMAWSIGDAASAFLLSPCGDDEGFLSFKNIHTGPSCGSMYFEPVPNAEGNVDLRLRAAKSASTALRDAANFAVSTLCEQAIADAKINEKDIAFLATTTPVAWYSKFAQRSLGFAEERTFNCHPITANTGPVLMPTNLFFGAHQGRVRKGDLVLMHTVGSLSSSGAAVLRWGDVKLGPVPGPTTCGE